MRRAVTLCCTLVLAACGSHTAPPAAAAPAPPPPLRFGSGSGRYRVDFTTSVVQEAMGQTSTIQSSASMLVTALLAAGADGNLAAAITVDSLTANSSQPLVLDQIQAARGLTYRSIYTTLGGMVSYAGADSARGSSVAIDLFRDFLPVLPSGAIAAGTSWTDTADQTQNLAQGLRLDIKAVREHRIVGWEPVNGMQALHIAMTTSYSLHGSGTAQGQPITAAGTGRASVDQFVSTSGQYLSATSSDSTNLTVTVTSVGLDVPVRQTRHGTITRLP